MYLAAAYAAACDWEDSQSQYSELERVILMKEKAMDEDTKKKSTSTVSVNVV